MSRRVVRTVTTLVIAGTVMVGLVACVGSTPNPAMTASPSAPSASSTPTTASSPTPSAPARPVLSPAGTAEDNKPFFDDVNQQFFIASGSVIPDGRAVIDNLVNLGFVKADMQVTPNRTAIDLPVDSLVFSVLMGDECLIGQYSAMGYSTIIAPKLTTGSCLVGLTRTIDW